jgi:hypothetical protein
MRQRAVAPWGAVLWAAQQAAGATDLLADTTRANFRYDDEQPAVRVRPWNPVVTNTREVIEAGRALGFEYPEPRPLRALLDTGASVTVISTQFAKHCRLFPTCEGTEISAIGATHRCGEHAGSISFPGTELRGFESIRIVSALFPKEKHYACLIGRDILRNWVITFDGRCKHVTISD